MIDIPQNDELIKNTNTHTYKKFTKARVKSKSFEFLNTKLKTHSKVQHIKYNKLEIQMYMVSPLFSNFNVNMLHALRSRGTECKVNFKQKYQHTSLKCSLCGIEEEDQKHLLTCNVILKYLKSKNISVSK